MKIPIVLSYFPTLEDLYLNNNFHKFLCEVHLFIMPLVQYPCIHKTSQGLL